MSSIIKIPDELVSSVPAKIDISSIEDVDKHDYISTVHCKKCKKTYNKEYYNKSLDNMKRKKVILKRARRDLALSIKEGEAHAYVNQIHCEKCCKTYHTKYNVKHRDDINRKIAIHIRTLIDRAANFIAKYYNLPKACFICGYDRHVQINGKHGGDTRLKKELGITAFYNVYILNHPDEFDLLCPSHNLMHSRTVIHNNALYSSEYKSWRNHDGRRAIEAIAIARGIPVACQDTHHDNHCSKDLLNTLTIGHPNGGGQNDRRKYGINQHFYAKINKDPEFARNGYFIIQCANCNNEEMYREKQRGPEYRKRVEYVTETVDELNSEEGST